MDPVDGMTLIQRQPRLTNVHWLRTVYFPVNNHVPIVDVVPFSTKTNFYRLNNKSCDRNVFFLCPLKLYGHPDNTDTMACSLGVRINRVPLLNFCMACLGFLI